MWLEKRELQEDMEMIVGCPAIPWSKLEGCTVLVTGATGLIGQTVINALLYANERLNLNVKILALVRELERARSRFAPQLRSHGELSFLVGSMEELPAVDGPVDYVIHGASPTASAYFAAHPVEVIRTAVMGTDRLLELARQKAVKGFVYLSSMEAYGAPTDSAPLREDAPGYINTASVRSCYPEAKRMCENMCAAYWKEYGVPAKSIRLAQTFGVGVPADDNRVFAQFARAAIRRENIILHTTGESRHPYLYTADAVTAILTVLLRGEEGAVYNAANPETFCSIMEMARMVAGELANDEIRVEVHTELGKAGQYPPAHHLNMDVEKLTAMGWKPARSLPEMYRRMMSAM